jgi:peptidyl-prolyl cis-trans isomerase D
VNEDEAFEEFKSSSDRMTLDYVKVNSSDLRDSVSVKAADLEAYFKENQEAYRIGEGAKVKYLKYAPSHFADVTTVPEDEISTYYSLNKDSQFTVEEQVGARHILKKFPVDADDDAKKKVRAAIDAVAAKLAAGEDFEQLAKDESEDGSAAAGGDLGKFGRGRMVKPFEDAAFALDVGAVSDVVESQFGYHIIKVYSHEKGSV